MLFSNYLGRNIEVCSYLWTTYAASAAIILEANANAKRASSEVMMDFLFIFLCFVTF